MLEANFVPYKEKAVTQENKLQMRKEVSRHSLVVTEVPMSSSSSVILGWTCSHFFQKHIDTSAQVDTEGTSERLESIIITYYGFQKNSPNPSCIKQCTYAKN
jgi:hypothetical protein